MDKSSRALLLEARTILYLLHSVVDGSVNWDDGIPRQEVVYLLSLARARLDALSYTGPELH